jgi:hypothetical protein
MEGRNGGGGKGGEDVFGLTSRVRYRILEQKVRIQGRPGIIIREEIFYAISRNNDPRDAS